MLKVIKIKSDEYIVVKIDEQERVQYLTARWWRSHWKVDAKIFFTENDATSALVIKKVRWDKIVEPEPVIEKELQSWSELQ